MKHADRPSPHGKPEHGGFAVTGDAVPWCRVRVPFADTPPGVLKQLTGQYPGGLDIDVSLVYGTIDLLQAVVR